VVCRAQHYKMIANSRTNVQILRCSNDGGGGERVLWRMLAGLIEQDVSQKLELVVYSGDAATTPRAILEKACDRFKIRIPEERVKFVFLRNRWLVEASTYPYFTMIGQSIGSMLLGLEALWQYCPHVYFGTCVAWHCIALHCIALRCVALCRVGKASEQWADG
jgi:hypothetical protein